MDLKTKKTLYLLAIISLITYIGWNGLEFSFKIGEFSMDLEIFNLKRFF